MGKPQYDIRPGLTLGRNYYVTAFLGSGWEGEVYKVEERRTGIPRAAKIFYDRRRISADQLQRYARKLYKLRTCNIVTRYHHRDVVRVGGRSVEIVVSELVEGEMLSAFLARQPRKRLSPFEALHLLYALAAGTEQIHRLREYHGDIHSNNILVVRRGLGFDVHLLDFFDLGRPNREKIGADVCDLIAILYEAIGGSRGYREAPPAIRRVVMGKRRASINRKYRTAGELRAALENLIW